MLMNTSRRTLLSILTITAVGAATHAANAQGAVILRTDGSGIAGARTMIQRIMPISDDTVKSLIERYEPDVLNDESDANVVTIVLDNAGNYVRSSSRHAKVMHLEAGHVVALNGDSGSVRVLAIPRPGDDVAAPAIVGGAATISMLRRADGSGEPNVATTVGFSPDEVDMIATKRFAAGTVAKSQLIVTVVKLK
jgi:hypothetical protein